MDVRLPNGTIVRNVPEGTTKAQLMAKVNKASFNPLQPFNRDPAGTPSMVAAPATEGFRLGVSPETSQQLAQQSEAIESQGGDRLGLERLPNYDLRKGLPFMGGLIGSMAGPGGTTIGALAGSSLTAGLGYAGGELARQATSNEPIDIAKAGKEGAYTAAGNMAGGLVLKGLSATARKLFSTPDSFLGPEFQQAASLAKEKGVPLPLSSAAPGSPASIIQQGTRSTLAGELRTQHDANKVAQFINREVSTIQAKGSPVDEAAVKGQQFLRKVFEPGETVYTEAFKGMREVVGDSTAIPLTNTQAAIQGVAEALKTRGATGALSQQIQTLAKRPVSEMTAQQVDDLYGELLKKAGRNPNAMAEMNVVLSALVKDVDAVGQQFGMQFADDIVKAKAVRDEFRELRKIPGLERLAQDFGERGGTLGSRQWMTELFGNPNGKALAELRSRNPELYHELADSWLANNIGRFSKSVPESPIGSVIDGPGMRTWYEQNAAKLKLIYGAPQAKALDNFTQYAKLMSGSMSRAAADKGFMATAFQRAPVEAAAGYFGGPVLLAPTEAGAYVLAKGLSDPNSTLFRLFTEGVKPGTMKFLEMSSKLGGQATARSSSDRN